MRRPGWCAGTISLDRFFNFAALMAGVRGGTKVSIENGAPPKLDALVLYHSNKLNTPELIA